MSLHIATFDVLVRSVSNDCAGLACAVGDRLERLENVSFSVIIALYMVAIVLAIISNYKMIYILPSVKDSFFSIHQVYADKHK